jgi:hypothetical protein
MRRIVFLVKNGVGFGHIRRCLLIAEQIRKLESGIDIVFVSQTSSLLQFESSGFRAINFPFLWRLPDNLSEYTYRRLLNQIMIELHPSLVVEDTNPDDWYLSLPALEDVPRMLLLRRIGPLSFDDYRQSGYFGAYDKVVLVQEESEFFHQKCVRESELLVRLSRIFEFTGPVFHQPTPLEIEEVAGRYDSDGVPLIVVNAGAGGEHLNEGYCERLFGAMREIAGRFLSKGTSGHFVFVVGPYYMGRATM